MIQEKVVRLELQASRKGTQLDDGTSSSTHQLQGSSLILSIVHHKTLKRVGVPISVVGFIIGISRGHPGEGYTKFVNDITDLFEIGLVLVEGHLQRRAEAPYVDELYMSSKSTYRDP